MNHSFSDSVTTAFFLITSRAPLLAGTVARSLAVSALASRQACARLGVARFRGRAIVLALLNTALALPSVVVGLVVYLLPRMRSVITSRHSRVGGYPDSCERFSPCCSIPAYAGMTGSYCLPDPKALLQLDAVSVNFGKVQALSGCSLQVHAGDRLALVGSNGSGKSTLLRTLHGLVRPATGCLQHAAQAR